MDLISPQAGVQILEAAIRSQKPYLSVSPINWAKFRPDSRQMSAYFQELKPQVRPGKPTTPNNEASLQTQVISEVAQILGISDSSQIDPEQNFFNLGLDSLSSLGLRNRLQTSLGCRLPATLIFKYPTVTKLVTHLSLEIISSNLPMNEK